MAISYPLTLPSHTGMMNVTFRAVNQTAMTMSPFSFKQQIHNHLGERWEAEVQLPPMRRTDADQWIAFLLSLKGRSGTFLMGDPRGATARGTLGGTPLIKGADQTGSTVTLDGCTASVAGWVKAGDYIQLGAASTATLHKVLQDANTNQSGEISIDIWPSIRSAPADNSTVVTANTVGNWRLNSGEQDWSVDGAAIYGITFACVESIT